MASVNPSNPELAQLLAAGAELSAFEAAAKLAVDRGKGFGYALGIVRQQLADAARMAADVREVTAGRKRGGAPASSGGDGFLSPAGQQTASNAAKAKAMIFGESSNAAV